MHTITVTWNDGNTTSRNSAKLFPFAWRAVNVSAKGMKQHVWGFSSTELAAQRSARTQFSGFSGTTTTEVKAL